MKKKIENKMFFNTIIDSLNKKESVSFVVKGNSMVPTLRNSKTEVFLKQKDKYHKKDICLFKKDEQYILHRLIKIKNDYYCFRGDQLYNYEVVKKEDIFAYVYQLKEDDKLIKTNHYLYIIRLNLYLTYKKFKMILRKIVKVFYARKNH